MSGARLGFAICLTCGQSHSPFTSKKSREDFDKRHADRCGHVVRPTGLFADVEVDVLGVHDVTDRKAAFSMVEALRMGAARVLDMEVEDLQILAIGHLGEDRCDLLLYDPMPGGSGLLEHLTERWEEVRDAALDLLTGCPSACDTSCIDCLQTYRNRFYHEHLDRHVAIGVLGAGRGPLVKGYDIPENLPKTGGTTGLPQTVIEARFKRFLAEAGLPAPTCQHPIDLGAGYGRTIPDFCYPGDDEPGISIYVDGMAAHIHGNPEQAAKDQAIRAKLGSLGYEVVVVRSFELDDKEAVVRAIARIAKYLVGKEKQRAVKDDTTWFERATAPPRRAPATLRLIRCEAEEPGAVPIFDLRIAAGAFSEAQAPEATGWARVEGASRRPGLFVAQVIGDSMDRVAPKGSWCLWQHMGAPGVAAPAVGAYLVVQRPDGADPDLGQFTFKRLSEADGQRRLEPLSHNPEHAAIELAAGDDLVAVARFVAVVAD